MNLLPYTVIATLLSGLIACGEVHAESLRRDITSLSPSELTAYRDAMRQLQDNGDYARLAGYHGCPDYHCHNDTRIFLPWHRAYVLEFERALQRIDSSVALHYWDWTSSDAISSGIQSAFTDIQYVSGGTTYPNPLRRFHLECEGQDEFTERFPDAPFLLDQLRNQVNSAFLRTTYDIFNANSPSPIGIQWPHGGLHGWVGGHMGSTTFAAYDPIFWSHHSNVDRQWANWQDSSNGADPSGSIQSLTLEPFGTTVADVLRYRALGYEYDRLSPAPFAALLVSKKGSAMIRGFRVPERDEPIGLYAHNVPAHPRRSFRIYVFVNQPDATVDDVKPDNPNFAGFFALFGGKQDPERRRKVHDEQAQTLRVMDLGPTVRRAVKEKSASNKVDLTVTLVATDPEGEVVGASNLPFDRISVRAGKEPDEEKGIPPEHEGRTMVPAESAVSAKGKLLSLPDADDQRTRLREYEGKPVVLIFFNGFRCQHCVKQLETFADHLRTVDVNVVCVSADEESLAEHGKDNPFVLLSDPSYETFRSFGCYSDHPLHGTFILDKNGAIVWKNVGEVPFMDVEVLLTQLDKLG